MTKNLRYSKFDNMRFLSYCLLIFVFGCSFNENTVNSYTLNVEGNIYKLKGELFNGKVLDANKNGRVLKSFRCIDGKIEGEYLEYYTNGSIKKRNNYKNGLLDGLSESYYDDGRLKLHQNYKKGVLNGYSKEVNYNGESSEGHYKGGLQDGLWIYRYPNKKIKMKGNFLKGDQSDKSPTSGVSVNGRIGEWLYFSTEGFLESRQLYKENSEIAEQFDYFTNGNLKGKGRFNLRTWEFISWEEFDVNGDVVNQ